MKTTFSLVKPIVSCGFVLASVGLVLSPAYSFAMGQMTAPAAANPKTSSFCADLNTKATTINTQVTNLVDKANTAWSQQDQKLTENFQKVDKDVATDRQKADTQRQATLTKLVAKATTSAEKQAVVDYGNSVQLAITARRNAYDVARQAFRSGLRQVIVDRHSTVTQQFMTFHTSVNDALNVAAASCVATPHDGPAIRQTLQASLKAARSAEQNDRKHGGVVGSQLTQLVATRTAAFKTADQTLQASLATARQTLQQAFSKKAV